MLSENIGSIGGTEAGISAGQGGSIWLAASGSWASTGFTSCVSHYLHILTVQTLGIRARQLPASLNSTLVQLIFIN